MSPLARTIMAAIRERPRQFSEIVDEHRDAPWPQFLKAWGEIRSTTALKRDEDGRYVVSSDADP